MSRSRSFCFTINNYTVQDEIDVFGLYAEYSCRYFIAGFELGENKTPHIQGYVYFTNQVTLSSVSKMLPRAHLEVSKGNITSNYDYCTKDGEFFEYGDKPDQGKLGKERIIDIMTNPYDNYHLYNQYRRSYKDLQLDLVAQRTRREVIIAPTMDLVDICKYYKTPYISGYDEDYHGEKCYVLPFQEYQLDQWVLWYNGFPKSVKIGYQIMKVNPKYLVVLFSDSQYTILQNSLKKLGIDYKEWRTDVTTEEELTEGEE